MRNLLFATVAALLAGTAASHAVTYTFTTIDNPADPTFNQLSGINNAGTIAGYYGSGAVGHPNRGYTVAAPYSTFVPDNYPNSVQTQATGINDAKATPGFWSDTNLGTGDANYGFIRFVKQGKPVFVDVKNPKTTSNPPINQVLGINPAKIAVGFFNDAKGKSHAYTYDATLKTFKPVLVAGGVSTVAAGINANGLVCGFFINQQGNTIGFTKNLSSGVVARVHAPGSNTTQLLGVNVKGQAVGFFIGSDGLMHGLIYTPGKAALLQVDNPAGTKGTVLNGVNDQNQAVGYYTDASNVVHGMLVAVTP